MTSLGSINYGNTAGGLYSATTHQRHYLGQLAEQSHKQRKWVYLLSDRLQFDQPQNGCIHLKLPAAEQMNLWLEKLISAGQAGVIFVDAQMSMDELSRQRLQQLCSTHQVALVQVKAARRQDNLVYGPW